MTRLAKAKLSVLTAASLGVALLTVPASAQQSRNSDPEVAMQIVTFNDLDLSTERDRRTLRSRLRDAARYVCGMDVRVTGSRFASPQAQQCYAEHIGRIDREVALRAERQIRRG